MSYHLYDVNTNHHVRSVFLSHLLYTGKLWESSGAVAESAVTKNLNFS